jgi:hypothetical protein
MYELARVMVLLCQFTAHAVNLTLTSERDFHENQLGESLCLHNGISAFNCHLSWSNWVKFGKCGLNVIPLSTLEVWKNESWGRHMSLNGINEFYTVFTPFGSYLVCNTSVLSGIMKIGGFVSIL